MWSIGCILAEFYNRGPVFPGKSYAHQVQVILDIMGTPPGMAFNFQLRSDAADYMRRQKPRSAVPLTKILPSVK